MKMSRKGQFRYPEIGVCGLSCRLCPRYHTGGVSRCHGCKTESRMGAGCPFHTCAVKNRGIEFCWECPDSHGCAKWRKHREMGKMVDSFKCYQKLEDDIAFLQQYGADEFAKDQKVRGQLLGEMLEGFNEGRSKSYYCIAATVLTIDELRLAFREAKKEAGSLSVQEKARFLHSRLDEIAKQKNYCLKLRK